MISQDIPLTELLEVRRASTRDEDAERAVAALAEVFLPIRPSVVLFFCSASYDLEALGRAWAKAFACPVVGCTSSGQIGAGGFERGGITAVALRHPSLHVTPYLIAPLDQCQARAAEIAESFKAERRPSPYHSFGLLLVDGLSLMEERLTAALFQSLGSISLVGGSAGDDLGFVRTHVYFGGKFRSDAAVLTIFETTLPFATFKTQHFRPTEQKVVITGADPEKRVVYELDGEPAAEVYARLVGCPVSALDAHVWSRHPLVLRLGGDDYVRSIAQVNPDGSLRMFCAIEEGLVLSIGESLDAMTTLARAFDKLEKEVSPAGLVIGCDCILRRIEFEERSKDAEVGRFLAEHGVIGFSTYGEQFNAVHVNQTFTGIALGRRP